MKTTYYVASSLDGYIAKEDGDVSWLEDLEIPIDDTGYDEFFDSVDGLIMGRRTYEMIKGFGEWPYGDKPIWVCSKGKVTAMEGCNLQTEHSPKLAYKQANELGIKQMWCVGGGSLASALFQSNLITDIYLSIMPIVLGNGIQLLNGLALDQPLKQQDISTHESGMVQIKYAVTRKKKTAKQHK